MYHPPERSGVGSQTISSFDESRGSGGVASTRTIGGGGRRIAQVQNSGRMAAGRMGGRGSRGRQQQPGTRQQQTQQRQMQQQPKQRMIRIPKLRFHVLQEMHGSYLTLRIFNYLDDRSRYSIFAAMGWPANNYNARKAHLAKQVENRRRIKAGLPPLECTNPNCNNARCPAKLKKAEEEARANGLLHTHQEEIVGLGTVKEEGDDSKDGGEGKKLCSEDRARPVEVGDKEGEASEDSPPIEGMAQLALGKTRDGGEDSSITNDGEDEKRENSNTETKVEALASESRDEYPQMQEVGGTLEEKGDTSDPSSEEEGSKYEKKKPEDERPLTPEEEALKKYRDEQELLPLLSSRVDPDTLLDRLNTRRLYKRINFYKRENRRKVLLMAETALEVAGGGADITDEDKIYSAIQQVMGANCEGISDMYDYDVKEKNTNNVVWKKNMTVREMASQEWQDLLELARCRKMGNELPRFFIPPRYELLMFTPCPRAVTALASYPRSGNSLMRTMYEGTTLRVTGSDMQGGLAQHDLVGEMAVGTNCVQFVKTHYPERRATPFRCARVVLLVRNPFDCIESFYNLMMTGKHTASVSEEVRQKTAVIWERYVIKELRVWIRFHMFWIKQKIPMLLVRYEDIIRDPGRVMERVTAFSLEVKVMSDIFDDRINRVIREQDDLSKMGSYKPRSGGIGKAFSKFSPELIKKMGFKTNPELRQLMELFGYDKLLKTQQSEWSEMPSLPDCGLEWAREDTIPDPKNPPSIILNRGNLARTNEKVTRWQLLKRELGVVEECKDPNCANPNCPAKRKEAAEKEARRRRAEETLLAKKKLQLIQNALRDGLETEYNDVEAYNEDAEKIMTKPPSPEDSPSQKENTELNAAQA